MLSRDPLPTLGTKAPKHQRPPMDPELERLRALRHIATHLADHDAINTVIRRLEGDQTAAR